jgi:hypothetical protein
MSSGARAAPRVGIESGGFVDGLVQAAVSSAAVDRQRRAQRPPVPSPPVPRPPTPPTPTPPVPTPPAPNPPAPPKPPAPPAPPSAPVPPPPVGDPESGPRVPPVPPTPVPAAPPVAVPPPNPALPAAPAEPAAPPMHPVVSSSSLSLPLHAPMQRRTGRTMFQSRMVASLDDEPFAGTCSVVEYESERPANCGS